MKIISKKILSPTSILFLTVMTIMVVLTRRMRSSDEEEFEKKMIMLDSIETAYRTKYDIDLSLDTLPLVGTRRIEEFFYEHDVRTIFIPQSVGLQKWNRNQGLYEIELSYARFPLNIIAVSKDPIVTDSSNSNQFITRSSWVLSPQKIDSVMIATVVDYSIH